MSAEHRSLVAPPVNDGASFADELESHRQELRTFCGRIVRDGDTADDLAQEAIVRAWLARSRFERRSTLRTWLFRIATNVCFDALRRNRRTRIVDADSIDTYTGNGHGADVPADGTPRADGTPLDEEVVERAAAEATLLLVMQRLPHRQRIVLLLRDGLGWSARDTARAIDGTVAATNSALQRARATARDALQPARQPAWGRSGGMSYRST